MNETFQLKRGPKYDGNPQQTVTVRKSDNNPWWTAQPNTNGAVPMMSALTRDEIMQKCREAGFIEPVA